MPQPRPVRPFPARAPRRPTERARLTATDSSSPTFNALLRPIVWLVGGLLALCRRVTYWRIARANRWRYLSDHAHAALQQLRNGDEPR
jgi:hypothetical protein